MSDIIRWGIVGTGNIAKQFARGLEALDDAQLVAVGSRAQDTADAFGDKFNVARRYATYQALADDPDVDAVYISTPHPLHKDNSIMCLRAGKAVLCEKPFTINARETQELIDVARETGCFLMEAMWTRFLPVIVQVREWLNAGVIGDVRVITADFGFRTDVEEESRLFDRAMGGGALLDVGIYVLSFTSMVMGRQPDRIAALAEIGPTGVDDQNGLLLSYPCGTLALLASATRTNTPQDARILGADGSIHIHSPFWNARSATLTVAGKPDETFEPDTQENGYNYEAAELMRCLRAGEHESAVMSLDESLAIMETMDAIRAQWGLAYPME